MAHAAIAIRELVKNYGSFRALDQVSFEIEQGSFVGLLGPNGAGKTTVISILGCLVRKTAGNAAVMGFDVATDPLGVRRNIGIVPQELVYDPFFSVREYLRQQSSYYGIYDNGPWISELLDSLALADKAKANTRTLSGGMKRRLMAAMALVHKPPVVVLDEPTAGVDVTLRRSLWQFIRQLNSNGTTVLLTTHYLDEAEELCDRIILLDNGKVRADQPIAELVRSGLHGKLSLHIRLAGDASLPEGIEAACRGSGSAKDEAGRHVLDLDSYKQIEQVLALLRERGREIVEMELAPPDLEDVFLALTSESAHA